MQSTANGKDSTAQPGDLAPQAGVGGPATGGSIEVVSRYRRIGEGRADTPARPEEGAGPDNERGRRAAVPGAPDSELEGRIRRMYLISQRSEYRLLAQPQRVAFRDMGRRLVTEHDDPTVVRGMLDVAQNKGWERINLAGSEIFRRLAWLEAHARGLETIGYSPTREDRQRLGEWLAERGDRVPARTAASSTVPKGADAFRASQGQDSHGANSLDRDGVAATVRPRTVSADDRDAVVLAVAEEVLRKRQVGEATRARVAAAIARRLAVLREQGARVSVQVYDAAERPSDKRPIEVQRGQSVTARSR